MFNVSVHFFSANNVIIYKEICLECLSDDIKILQQLHISWRSDCVDWVADVVVFGFGRVSYVLSAN